MKLRSRGPTPALRRLLPKVGLFLCIATALACRYSIRDTGFVDLGEDIYRLEFQGVSEELIRSYRQSATAVFLDANIEWQFNSIEGTSSQLELVAPDGRRWTVADSDTVPDKPDAITALLEAVARSPFRDRLYTEAIEAFALLVLVPGTDMTANEAARTAVRAAIRDVAQRMPHMPKPVDNPPRLLELDPDRISEEAITLWGLGLEPRQLADPQLAIVYGRGRRLGSPLEGPLITRTALQERLALIGQDCECELDRAWLKGPLIPGRWDPGLQTASAKALGFDPQNPMIRAEVGRIVQRGAITPGATRRLTAPSLTLGYAEESLDFGEDEEWDFESTQTVVDPEDPGETPILARAAGNEPDPPVLKADSPSTTDSVKADQSTAPAPALAKETHGVEDHPEALSAWEEWRIGLWSFLGGLGVLVAGISFWLWRRAGKEQG